SRQSESMPNPSLDRIRALAELMADPQLTYPSIHVTGTNGKTTTARVVTALACAHGLTTGTFISPHVTAVTERVSVCDQPISEDEFAEAYEHVLPFLENVDGLGRRVTYFETLTALAYLWFADKPVGLGVFEVGMGGAWDATNLIRSDVAVLCPIGLDHVKQLGPAIEDIAEEKAGIIKEGRIAVVREQRSGPLAVIERRCKEMDASMLLEGRDFALTSRTQGVGGQAISIRGLHGSYEEVFFALFGEHAARNSAASIVACEALLGRALGQDAVKGALRKATSPGRIEVVGRRPLVVLDGAHNPDAAEALVIAIQEAFQWDRLHLVMAMFGDKDVETVAGLVAALADRAYVTVNGSPRSAPAERVAEALRESGMSELETFASVAEAVAAARDAAAVEDLILVTGSFYTVADARPLFVGG
ncbi:MAG TPA: folylpolyglutamate synthase/dihydrofolate synthase family protein, partial [Actinomycetota bacterium]|nr:folylpolyglutamate synthase/dihydrofolate synthase family protein [Actinomycetota bacterium]